MDRREALILLNACESFDGDYLEGLRRDGLDAVELVQAGPSLWKELGLTERVQSLLSRSLRRHWPEEEMERCRRQEISLVTLDDREYPSCLRSLPKAPLLLYVRGRLPSLDTAAAIVGTRRCSSYGRRVAQELGRRLSLGGSVVVSGGAAGIDGAAHSGALEGEASTIAVLGTGVDRVFPQGHDELFRTIADRGALVSEYPLGTEARGWRFPRRNRIIVGLASRLVVVEAPKRSGAMITARIALEASREVWVVPGRVGEAVCEGSNRLLFDGAFPLVDLDEFVGVNGQRQLALFETSRAPEPTRSLQLSSEEKALYFLLRDQGERAVDNLAAQGKMGAADVVRILSLLSARGLVYPSGPGRWSASPEL